MELREAIVAGLSYSVIQEGEKWDAVKGHIKRNADRYIAGAAGLGAAAIGINHYNKNKPNVGSKKMDPMSTVPQKRTAPGQASWQNSHNKKTPSIKKVIIQNKPDNFTSRYNTARNKKII